MQLLSRFNFCVYMTTVETKLPTQILYRQESSARKVLSIAFTSVTAVAIPAIFVGLNAVINGLESHSRGFGFVPGGPFVM